MNVRFVGGGSALTRLDDGREVRAWAPPPRRRRTPGAPGHGPHAGLLLGLALLALACRGGRATVEARGLGREDLATLMRSADSTWVRRVAGRTTPARDSTRIAVATPEWTRRFVDVVMDRAVFEPRAVCRADIDDPTDAIDTLTFEVNLMSGGQHVRASLWFQHRCAQVELDFRGQGAIDMDSTAATLFALMREALPRDRDLQGMVLRPPREEWMMRRRSSSHWVYVEELPEVIRRAHPVYPPAALARKIKGTVLVQALIGTDGRVKRTRVVQSIPELDAAAVAAVRKWRFRPARTGGRPAEAWVAIPVRFPP